MYLLDTNVVSELRKVRLGKADSGVARWAEEVATSNLYLSVVTVQELEIGVALAHRRDVRQGAVLREWLEHRVLPAFEERILSVDLRVARRTAALHVPDPRPIRDAFIGATALVHGMIVVTRNTADFEPMGVSLLNPWQQI